MTAVFLSIAALIVIIVKGIGVINQMGRHTCHCQRAAWILVTITAAVSAFDLSPTWSQMVFYLAVAALLALDRRDPFRGCDAER